MASRLEYRENSISIIFIALIGTSLVLTRLAYKPSLKTYDNSNSCATPNIFLAITSKGKVSLERYTGIVGIGKNGVTLTHLTCSSLVPNPR